MDTNNAENCLVFVTVVDSGKLYSDQTGHFPFTSIRGVKYVFILYLYDTNSVFSQLLNSRTGYYILHTYTAFNYYLKESLFEPKIHWLYNKACNYLKKYNRNHNQINATEKEIQTWKTNSLQEFVSQIQNSKYIYFVYYLNNAR